MGAHERKTNRRYFSGYFAKAKVLLLEDGPHPDRPGVTVWKLLITENEQQGQRQAPSRDHGRDRAGRYDPAPRERHAQRDRAQAAGQAIAGQRDDWAPEPLPPGGDEIPW